MKFPIFGVAHPPGKQLRYMPISYIVRVGACMSSSHHLLHPEIAKSMSAGVLRKPSQGKGCSDK